MSVVRVLAFLFGLALFSVVLLVVAAAVLSAAAIRVVEKIADVLRWPAAVPGGVTC